MEVADREHARPAREDAMFTLVLIGYVVLGGGQYAGSSIPQQTIVGHFDSAQACADAVKAFDRAKAFKDVTDNMHEYRWGFLCAPGGSGATK
jgi:hypothetical protein